jgi:hypothetical protein
VEYAPESRDEARCSVELDSIACGSVALVGNGFRTWHIHADGSGDAPTVQAGIDSSHVGDVVLVGPGTYYENINLRGRAIHLVSEAGPETTILDGSQGDAPVIVCKSHEHSDTVIEGFTLTGGSGAIPIPSDPSTRVGGGIWCYFSEPTIRNNIIRGNKALNGPQGGNSRGGGISLGSPDTYAPVLIEGNVIEDNYCSRNSGGINIGAPCIIQDNVIRGNATGTGDGGGLYLIGDVGRVVIRRNWISDNTAADHGGGVYIATFLADPTMTEVSQNLILNNNAYGLDGGADCSGGGVWIEGGAVVKQNTIAFNTAENLGLVPAGGGCCLENSVSGTTVSMNILYKNVGGGLMATERAFGEERNNIIFKNGQNELYIEATAQIAQGGDFFVDPLFCDTTATSTGAVAENSPALTDSLGVIGAVAMPGCGPKAPAVASPWGRAGRRDRK